MVTFNSAVTIERQPDEVFAFVADPLNEPRWHRDVVAVKQTVVLIDGKPRKKKSAFRE